ncbi:hypothetical protein ACFQ6U_17810 [Streptomyces sp. NPDC056465]|uniref:hypothetical protein n=1 Tax=Streptomyces sp. NPDC056465 TaxID=3345829 RepID=UPI003686D8F6
MPPRVLRRWRPAPFRQPAVELYHLHDNRDEETSEPDTHLSLCRRRAPGDAWVSEERSLSADRSAELSGTAPPPGRPWVACGDGARGRGDILVRIEPLTRRQTVHARPGHVS